MSWCLYVIVKAVTQHRLRFQQRIPSLYSSGLGRRWRKTGWKAGFHLGSVSVSSFCLFNSWKRHNEKKKPWLKLSMPQSCILTFRSLKSDTFKSETSVLELSDWLGSYFPLFSPVSRSSTKIPGRTCQKNVAWFHCVLTQHNFYRCTLVYVCVWTNSVCLYSDVDSVFHGLIPTLIRISSPAAEHVSVSVTQSVKQKSQTDLTVRSRRTVIRRSCKKSHIDNLTA